MSTTISKCLSCLLFSLSCCGLLGDFKNYNGQSEDVEPVPERQRLILHSTVSIQSTSRNTPPFSKATISKDKPDSDDEAKVGRPGQPTPIPDSILAILQEANQYFGSISSD